MRLISLIWVSGIISNFLLLPEAALPLVGIMSISELFSDDAVDDDFCPIDFKAELTRTSIVR